MMYNGDIAPILRYILSTSLGEFYTLEQTWREFARSLPPISRDMSTFLREIINKFVPDRLGALNLSERDILEKIGGNATLLYNKGIIVTVLANIQKVTLPALAFIELSESYKRIFELAKKAPVLDSGFRRYFSEIGFEQFNNFEMLSLLYIVLSKAIGKELYLYLIMGENLEKMSREVVTFIEKEILYEDFSEDEEETWGDVEKPEIEYMFGVISSVKLQVNDAYR